MSRIPKDVAATVIERANGCCEMCGYPFGVMGERPIFHHRQALAMGGSRNHDKHTVGNIIQIHDECHTHAHANPDWARDLGYIVSQYAETP